MMPAKPPVEKIVGSTEVRNKLGQFLNRVHRGEENLLVEKLGIPVAAIISMEEYRHYRRLILQERHRELGARLGREAKRQGLTEERLIADMEKDRQSVYDKLYGKQS